MRVQPKSLIRRFTSTATRMLERAASQALSTKAYEIIPEHMLRQLLTDEQGDVALILRYFQIDRSKALAQVEDTLRRLRVGNDGRPIFSASLFQWFEDAWLLASLEHGALRLRSGALMAQWIASSGHYSAESYAELSTISIATLMESFEAIVGTSNEVREAIVGTSNEAREAPGLARTLVRRLTKTATLMLEGAASLANTARCYEITPEHMLRAILEDEGSEGSLILRHFQVDRARVIARVENTLRGLRTGNADNPKFSENLLQWFEHAWVVASLEYGALRLRSGALMAHWIARPARYSAESYPELDAISTATLKESFEAIVGTSNEAREATVLKGFQ